jgi:prolyl oligopeptidase
MRTARNTTVLLAGALALACGAPAAPARPPAPPWTAGPYPPARAEELVELLHGVEVADPYRWLEDDEDAEVQAWQQAQTALAREILEAIPGRDRVRDRLAEVFRVAEEGVPSHKGGNWFQLRRAAEQDQPVLYTSRGFPGERRALVDPNALGAGDNTVALDWWYPSPDGELLAFGLSASGSERSTLHVVRTATGERLAEGIPDTRSSKVAWLPDGSAFYYTRRPPPDSGETWFNRVFFHRLGTPWQEDPLVFGADSGDEAIHWPALSPNGEHLVVHVFRGSGGTETDLYYRPARKEGARFVAVAEGRDATFGADVLDDRMIVRTNWRAPRYRVLEIRYDALGEEHWKELVPEGEDTIDGVLVISGRLVVRVMRHAAHRLFLHATSGKRLREIPLPGLGRVAGLEGEFDDEEFFYGFTSFFHAGDIYRRRLAEDAAERVGRIEVPLDPSRFTVEQVFYRSQDGTRVPMFLARLADPGKPGPRPVVMYAYGGFNVALTPFFLGRYLPFIEAGGVFAMPNLRGGSEYGEEWHRRGMREHKRNVFDDFHGAAEHLIREGITTAAMLGVRGGSNGGLLVGAALVQRPELYGGVVCAVPLLDMLRYHRFLIAKLWVPEYGSADDPEQFAYLRAYSPYHNVPEGAAFPPTLITTAESDSRVAPLHARKMAALLQARQAGTAPILLHVEQKAGHGQGKPVDKQIEDTADHLAFLMRAVGLLP